MTPTNQKPLLVRSIDEQGYGSAVEAPEFLRDAAIATLQNLRWHQEIASAPVAAIVHPSFNCKVGDWITEWVDGYQYAAVKDNWIDCDKETYDKQHPAFWHRIVLLPLTVGEENPPSDLICPFCCEDNFDKPGLKHHLKNWCEVFLRTENI